MGDLRQQWDRISNDRKTRLKYAGIVTVFIIVLAAVLFLSGKQGIIEEEEEPGPFHNLSALDSNLVVRVDDQGYRLWIEEQDKVVRRPYAILQIPQDGSRILKFENHRNTPITLKIRRSTKNPGAVDSVNLNTQQSGAGWFKTYTFSRFADNVTFWVEGEPENTGEIRVVK